MIKPVVILHGSRQYEQACQLRDEILRKPLGLSLYDEDLQAESTFYHYGIFDEDTIIACVVAVPDTGSLVQIRQMAVARDHRSKGVGTHLMQYIEESLLKKGFSNFFLNARREAVSFYQKLGYRTIGDEFLEVSIPHRKMEKNC
jgi:predicted GNAT family N-acyltransferase